MFKIRSRNLQTSSSLIFFAGFPHALEKPGSVRCRKFGCRKISLSPRQGGDLLSPNRRADTWNVILEFRLSLMAV